MNSEESQIQIACVNWFRMQYPKLARLLIAVPNGGKRPQKTVWTQKGFKTFSPEGKKLKAEGAIAGVADLVLLAPNLGYGCLAIEMKTETSKQSQEQKEWQLILEKNNGYYAICRNIDEFMNVVNNYLKYYKK